MYSWQNIPWEFPGCCNVLMAIIDYMTHYLDCNWLIISRGDNRKTGKHLATVPLWNSGQMLSNLAHSSLKVHCSYRLSSLLLKIT